MKTITLTADELESLYFDIIISKYNSNITIQQIHQDFNELGRFVDIEILYQAYLSAIEFIKDVESV